MFLVNNKNLASVTKKGVEYTHDFYIASGNVQKFNNKTFYNLKVIQGDFGGSSYFLKIINK